MTCDEAEILLHALIDGELDAGHAREVEAHIAGCARCTAALAAYRQMREAIDARPICATPRRRACASASTRRCRRLRPCRPRTCSRCRAGARCCAALRWARRCRRWPPPAWSPIVLRNDDQQRIESEIVSAHLRSLQAGHLIDVVSTDQHTVKPWFNGKLDVSPPVIDLTAQGFTLIGGRLDYVDARAIGAVVYKRRAHVINLFVAQTSNTARKPAKIETVQGFNIRRWSDRGLNYWAVSDIGADELAEFGEKFEAAAAKNKEG